MKNMTKWEIIKKESDIAKNCLMQSMDGKLRISRTYIVNGEHMAFIDSGCLYKVNDVLQNPSNPYFMEPPEWVPKVAYDKDGNRYDIKGNFFAYLGDADFFLCFYKFYWLAVSGDKVLYVYDKHNINETNIINGIEVRTENIDKTYRIGKYWYPSSDKRSEDNLYSEDDFYTLRDYYRYVKFSARHPYKELSRRYRTRFTYKGNSYDVLYGYGIDTQEVMNNLLGKYDFIESELTIINNWIKGE